MTRYSITTTGRDVFIDAQSPEHAKAIFLRREDPPEPFPDDKADREAYFGRRLSLSGGECLIGPIREAEDDEPEWDSQDSNLYQDRVEAGEEAEFPGYYQGAGPMFAAVSLGDPWYDLAVSGATTYVVDVPGPDPEHVDGWAFLDRGQAEAVADAVAGGEFSRYEGLCGWYDRTPARAQADRQAEPEAGS